MTWGTAYAGSNNIHFKFPALMSDGRLNADWQPGAQKNEAIRKDANVATNWQYRRYLTNNADSIIKDNQLEACNQCGCIPYNDNNIKLSNTPYLYNSCLSRDQPYGYEDSDLKNIYLSRNELQCRLTARAVFTVPV
jgi:hypothetical protein